MPARSTPPPTPLVRQRLLSNVKLQGDTVTTATAELERRIVQAYRQGCSLRDLAAAAGFGSHHKVQELLVRHKVIRPDNRQST